ncbi:MAG: hypothetical protein F4226_05230 [Synechococcus sp. SB0678_bin_12]|nr:hypothetical protein [Synechococcus sp. SB0678_bin_12]
MCSPFAGVPTGVLTGVLAGVLVAVFSQLLLKGIVEPAQQLKGKIAEVGMQLELLNNRPSFIDENYGITQYDINLINKLSAEIHSLPYQIPMYARIRYLCCLPSRDNMKKVYCKLNELSSALITLESIKKDIKIALSQELFQENFQKDTPRRSRIEQRDGIINRVKILSQEIRKLLNIRT